ncbi:MAG TPA: hypothetical protein VGE24_14605 [Emticicia sp.]
MEAFQVKINDRNFTVVPRLHDNFYSVSYAGRSAMLGKEEDGEWEFSLQSSEDLDVSAREIGEVIEMYLKNRDLSSK